MITTINNGEIMTVKNSRILNDLAYNHFNEKSFIYISNRLNSYSVDPNIYSVTSKYIKGYAIVSNSELAIANAKYEGNFTKIPFRIFTSIEKAVSWAEEMQSEQIKSSS
jgi:hypothetical protein